MGDIIQYIPLFQNEMKIAIQESFLLTNKDSDCIYMPIQIAAYRDLKPKVVFSGNTMKNFRESFDIAKTFLMTKHYNQASKYFNNNSIHLHMPYNQIHKGGLSGSLAISVMFYCLVFGFKLSKDIVFTGEMSLNGSIYPVSMINQKVSEKLFEKFKNVVVSERNKPDLKIQREQVIFVDNICEVLKPPFLYKENQIYEI